MIILYKVSKSSINFLKSMNYRVQRKDGPFREVAW